MIPADSYNTSEAYSLKGNRAHSVSAILLVFFASLSIFVVSIIPALILSLNSIISLLIILSILISGILILNLLIS